MSCPAGERFRPVERIPSLVKLLQFSLEALEDRQEGRVLGHQHREPLERPLEALAVRLNVGRR